MTEPVAPRPLHRSTAALTTGGALVAVAGLVLLVQFLGTGGVGALPVLAAVALAAGAVTLALPAGDIVRSRVGQVALVVFGIGPLVFLLPLPPVALPGLLGTAVAILIAAATLVVAVTVARAGVLRGVARWAPVVLVADAVLTALLSTVRLGPVTLLYPGWHLELVRPAALLVWGLAIVLQAQAGPIRSRRAAIVEEWRRSTDVGGTASPEDPERRP